MSRKIFHEENTNMSWRLHPQHWPLSSLTQHWLVDTNACCATLFWEMARGTNASQLEMPLLVAFWPVSADRVSTQRVVEIFQRVEHQDIFSQGIVVLSTIVGTISMNIWEHFRSQHQKVCCATPWRRTLHDMDLCRGTSTLFQYVYIAPTDHILNLVDCWHPMHVCWQLSCTASRCRSKRLWTCSFCCVCFLLLSQLIVLFVFWRRTCCVQCPSCQSCAGNLCLSFVPTTPSLPFAFPSYLDLYCISLQKTMFFAWRDDSCHFTSHFIYFL